MNMIIKNYAIQPHNLRGALAFVRNMFLAQVMFFYGKAFGGMNELESVELEEFNFYSRFDVQQKKIKHLRIYGIELENMIQTEAIKLGLTNVDWIRTDALDFDIESDEKLRANILELQAQRIIFHENYCHSLENLYERMIGNANGGLGTSSASSPSPTAPFLVIPTSPTPPSSPATPTTSASPSPTNTNPSATSKPSSPTLGVPTSSPPSPTPTTP
ncbi:MAG: hypothetical protein IJT88_04360 [Kiritimatiellae bacterium]|nr:hypothetical protein [Kiritimatiellia bacterium]